MTIWEAAVAAAEQERTDRIAQARATLQAFVGPDVELPPGTLVNELGIILHNAEGTRGILVTDAGTHLYVTREPGGQITPVGEPLTSLADLGRLLA
jgi:hypothetical protein